MQGLIAAVATVAIAMRMAPKFPKPSAEGSWRYEQATERYFYGLDKERPWDVSIFRKMDLEDDESWKEIGVDGLYFHSGAGYQTNFAPDSNFQDLEEYEVASIISMSQGMAGFQVVGQGPETYSASLHEWDMNATPIPRIHTTREAMFRHG